MKPLVHFASVLAFAAAAPAFADDAATGPVVSSQSAGGPALVFSLRGGVAGAPAYFGSEKMEAAPDLGFNFHFLRFGDREFGNPDPWQDSLGFGVHGSFRYIGERDSSDHSKLRGLDDVDAALELGLGVGYATENLYAFADVRRGFGGHEGTVAEVGFDAVIRPNDRLRLAFGPRFFWGNDEYADTYFGITPAESSASLPTYDPDGGLLSAGVEFSARYKINDLWGIEGAVNYNQLNDDAEDSPIVRNGDRDQWAVRIGFTRVFSIGG
ncbi:MipA/OmpV family protein [Puniceibacterium sp. IMCC21224]|uniref:MipA/OmpV family protein n=1 Tax=Puniceibacterium sp. IMCC21224 TaxID=1618204 RepID=UPI00064D95B0|nr:MipA/OmpV family protein [Puniceibacterium sp. IMCC21224]KMK68760.1 outer membrane protein V [Puniceibacterium sp. IMCC21224]